MPTAMDGVTEFLKSSTIHGLSYIPHTRALLTCFWMFVISTGFIGAGILIKQSFESWHVNPVFTTIETLPISEIDFPKVTVCPPRNTFTNLNYDLLRIGNLTVKEETKRELLQYLPEALYDGNFEEKLKLYKSFHGKDSYKNWYMGYTEISLPYTYKGRLTLESMTHALSGVVSTPHFRETFQESNFEPYLLFKIYIYVPESLRDGNKTHSIVFSIEYDVETSSDMEYVQLGRGDYYDMKYQQLEPALNRLDTEIPLDDDKYYVQYFRRMKDQYKKWKTRRNTGMRVSWRYTSPAEPENKAKTANRLYIKLANALHQTEYSRQELSAMARSARLQYLSGLIFSMQLKCNGGKYSPRLEEKLYDQLGNVSSDEIFRHEVSQDTLEEAADIYIYLVHCPDNYHPIMSLKGFYSRVIEKSSLRTLLIVLARMIFTARSSEKMSEMRTATLLLRKLSEKIEFGYETLDIMTSGLSDITKDKDLLEKYRRLSNTSHWWSALDWEQVRKTNHPVHIAKSPSAFIPFCSFGGDMTALGHQTDHFDHPTCSSFNETILDGNLCYEIDLSRFEDKITAEKSKKIGLSLLIDNNEEYDTSKIIFGEDPAKHHHDFTESFVRLEETEKIMIHIQTIRTSVSFYSLLKFYL